jgi:hypothetical protein
MSDNVTFNLRGGDKFKAQLQNLARSLNTARAVRIGFLEGSDYPEGDGGARLMAAAKRVFKAHPGWGRLLAAWSRWQAKHPRGLSVAQVAFWNEFGTSTSKPRPFFRLMIRQHSGEWGKKLARYLKGAQFDAEVALNKLGMLIAGQLQESIQSWPADNAPLTVAVKGFNHGLVDSMTMARAVDFEVVHE